jgi:type IV secretion/conjugal transfer VirB4 family ATPase
MFKLSEFRAKADRLSDILPWAALVGPGIVLNKDGSLMQIFRYRGPDLESSTEPQLVSSMARLNNALKRLGSGWAIFTEARRRQAMEYPSAGSFQDEASELLDYQRRVFFEAEEQHFESDYYLTLQYLPPTEAVSKISKAFISNDSSSEAGRNYHRVLEQFRGMTHRIFDILKDFMFEAVELNDAEVLTYLHSTVSTQAHPIRVPDIPMYLDAILADTPLTGGVAPKLGHWHIRTLSILGFPSSTVPAILDQLNHLPSEYRWVTRFLPLDKLDAEKTLKSYRRQWFAKRKGILTLLTEAMSKSESQMVDSGAVRKSQDADAALQELSEDYVSFGYFTATVTVWDEDLTRVQEKLRDIERVLGGMGFATINENINGVEAWLSSLPGHVHANVRMPIIHTLNLAHMIPFSSPWAGPARCAHLNDSVLSYARTAGNTPFRLSPFVGDVGHQMVIGPTGAGKSVLLNMMAMQFLRYEKAQVFIFDKGGSFLVSTACVGGKYYNVGNTEKSGESGSGLVFQPLANIDQHHQRMWAAEWLCGLLQNENIEINSEVKERVWDALTNLSRVPVVQRTFTGLSALIQDRALRQALEPYLMGGSYGNILDAEASHFFDSHWQCFEMEHLMQTQTLIAPVLSYLFHELESRFDGRPTLMVLDEAWLFLDHPLFASKIKEWLKTLRKKNVAVIFATQSVEDALSSEVASSLIESCPSRIFLPNDRALEPKVRKAYEELGLNDRQIHILSNAIPKREYYFQSHIGNALFDLDLDGVALAFCGSSSTKDQLNANQWIDKVGVGYEFAKQWLLYKKLPHAAELLETLHDARKNKPVSAPTTLLKEVKQPKQPKQQEEQ